MFIVRFILSFIFILGIAAILWTQTGLFAWVGGLQVAAMDRYSPVLTLMLTVLICLAPLLLILSLVPGNKNLKKLRFPNYTHLHRSVSCGGLIASAMILAFGLAPLFTPSPPVPAGELSATVAHATWIPSPAKLSLAEEHKNIDLEKQISFGVPNSTPTIYAPIHLPGSSQVLGVVSGTENDWRNASISASPFPNPANDAALARSRDAVLTLQPVPFVVRRHLAAANLPVPVFLPTFQWGRHPLTANLPLIIGGSCAVILFFITLIRPRKAASLIGLPADM